MSSAELGADVRLAARGGGQRDRRVQHAALAYDDQHLDRTGALGPELELQLAGPAAGRQVELVRVGADDLRVGLADHLRRERALGVDLDHALLVRRPLGRLDRVARQPDTDGELLLRDDVRRHLGGQAGAGQLGILGGRFGAAGAGALTLAAAGGWGIGAEAGGWGIGAAAGGSALGPADGPALGGPGGGWGRWPGWWRGFFIRRRPRRDPVGASRRAPRSRAAG